MTGDDPRTELAEIVHSVRRTLERERAAGSGELLLNAAARARISSANAGPGTGGTAFGLDDAPSAPAHASAAYAPAESQSLFGEPSTPAPHVADAARAGGKHGAAAGSSAAEFDLPPFHEPLNPAGVEARAAIAEAARPLLEQIAEEVKKCKKCALWESRTKAVPGVGSAKSGIVFVGEGPGADEDRLGEPFVGRAGQLLDKIIEAMDNAKLIPGVALNRDTVFIGNIIHCRPPENRVPLPIEVEMSSPFLMRQLDAIKPRIICCLGKTAAEMLLGVKGALGGMRGRIYRLKGAKMIVTYHPAACLRNPAYKRPVWEDMQLLAREYLAD